jgi:D-arginine dehydrogenase
MARHLLVSAPHPLSSGVHPWTWVDDVGVYARPEAGGWLVSPCDERAVDAPPGPGSSGPVDADQRAVAHDKIERWMPALREITFRGGWTGLRTFTADRHPLLGEDPVTNGLIWFCGFGGFGVSCAVGAAETVFTEV